MSNEQRRAISAQNSGRGLSRVEIAERAFARAKAQLADCERRLAEARANEAKHGETRQEKEERKRAKALAVLQADADLQEQARRILASLDESKTTTAS